MPGHTPRERAKKKKKTKKSKGSGHAPRRIR